MVAVKGRYDGMTVVLDRKPTINECEVIVTFLENPVYDMPLEHQPNQKGESSIIDDGSLNFLFRDYMDDGIREPIINFGQAVGNEQW